MWMIVVLGGMLSFYLVGVFFLVIYVVLKRGVFMIDFVLVFVFGIIVMYDV